MSEQKQPPNGTFCWYELASRDLSAVRDFYSGLLGWNLAQSKITDLDYLEISLDGEPFGGLMQMTDEWKMPETGEYLPSHWMNYIAVDDVDATAEKARTLGANICVEPVDIPPIGRFAIINDPQGATFTIINFSQE
jgi:uncharacterized protein